MSRKVTEADLRRPELAGAHLDDLEFDDDGQVVRRDRWKTAMMAVIAEMEANQIGSVTARNFSLPAVQNQLRTFVQVSALPPEDATTDKAAILEALGSARVLNEAQRTALAALVEEHMPDPAPE